ncbi:hypothetical protein Hanom_Chr14g01322321 [Helianthus anomalus]
MYGLVYSLWLGLWYFFDIQSFYLSTQVSCIICLYYSTHLQKESNKVMFQTYQLNTYTKQNKTMQKH